MCPGTAAALRWRFPALDLCEACRRSAMSGQTYCPTCTDRHQRFRNNCRQHTGATV